MKAQNVMVSPVITAKPHTPIRELAQLLVEKGISGVPVVDDEGRLVGMISEGDLLHRAEIHTERRRSWWLRMMSSDGTLASDYVQAHGAKVADLMSRKVISATPETPLREIAIMLEKNRIKRVPIVQDGRLVGIVSRANLVQALANAPRSESESTTDEAIRESVLARLNSQPWVHTTLVNVTVADGVVSLWGIADSATEMQALRVVAETTPGVRGVNDYLAKMPVGNTM